VAFIELPTKSGSGFLFGDGYIVTNAHVVWPFDKARVVFAEGEEHENVPVANWDMLRDLAVLGPIETDIEPLPLIIEEERIVGDDVYVIGYPGEVDTFPEPTIGRGLISRIREWDSAEMTYYQVDARFGHGQSGGVIVSDRAEVVGVANFIFDDSGYGLAASAVDVKPNLEQLIASKDEFAEDSRRVSAADGKRAFDFVDLHNDSQVQTFIVDEPSDTEIEIEVDGGDNDLAFWITNANGDFIDWIDQGYTGVERYRFTTEVDAPYYVNVTQFSGQAIKFSIEADHKLIHYLDFDDNRGVLFDDVIDGCIDYPGDSDNYLLSLDESDRVNILVDSIMIDPFLELGLTGNYVEDDDSGSGVFGLNSELTFAAVDRGTYSLRVSDSWGSNSGCYKLYIREPYDGAPSPLVLEWSDPPFYTDYGDMWTYETSDGQFSVNVPADWSGSGGDLGELAALCKFAELCLANSDGTLAIISIEDLSILGSMTQQEYVDFYRNLTTNAGYQIDDERPFETRTGLQGTILELSMSGTLKLVRFMYVHQGTGFNVSYVMEPGQERDLMPMMEYTFSSVAVVD
jgi:hypothetical protein